MSASDVRLYRGQVRVAALDPLDRGLAYGDGLFETIRIHRGGLPWWPAHSARLLQGARRLGIDSPAADWLAAEVQDFVGDCEAGVLRLQLTRGCGGRGYAPPAEAEPSLILSRHPLPVSPAALRLRWCELVLAEQPRLAGLKHANRLEQILARAEWNDPAIHEGLLCDARGHAICAIAANLFVHIDGRWLTPRLERCGVHGVMRRWLLEHVEGAAEAELSRTEVEAADALALGNAVRGILAVAQLGSRCWPAGTAVPALQAQLATVAPMFASPH